MATVKQRQVFEKAVKDELYVFICKLRTQAKKKAYNEGYLAGYLACARDVKGL